MKHCPTCNQDYADDSLSFCLNDGSPLTTIGSQAGSAPGSYDPSATLAYNTGRPTDPAPPSGFGASAYPPPANPSWGTQAAPPRKSKALWWILGIVAVVIVGAIGIVFLVGVLSFASYSSSSTNGNSSNPGNVKKPDEQKNPIDTINHDNRKLILKDDFSQQKWSVSSSAFGSAAYVAGSYQLTAIPDRYFVMYAPSDDYITDDGTTVKVTVRNVTSKTTNHGYGVAVHGHVENGQANDYAFLIVNGDLPQFTIVMHTKGVTTTVKDWTKSTAIRTGTTPNQLEVKINKEQLTFSINGELAATVNNDAGFSNGLVGLCMHDPYPVAFDDLEIYR